MHSYQALNPTTFLERNGQIFPNQKAIIHAERVLTYGELLHRTRCLAQSLKRLQVSYGERVAVLAENCPEVIEAHYGVPGAGAVLVMLNPWLTTTELLQILNYCEAKILIVQADLINKVPPESLSKLENLSTIVCINNSSEDVYSNTLNYETCLSHEDGSLALDEIVRNELDLLTINFTSGTTGQPKGVMGNYRGAYLNAIGQTLMIDLNRMSKYLWTMPMFHVNGWGHMWANVAVRALQIIPSRKEIEHKSALVDMISKYRITHLCGAPRLIRFLADIPDPKQAFKGLTVTTGGAAPSTTLIERLDKMGIRFIHQYGLSETYGPYVVCEEQDEWHQFSSNVRAAHLVRQGVPTIHAGTGLRVVDEAGRDVPHDGSTIGEVLMAGNTVSMGYYKAHETNKKTFSNGYFHSSDIAVIHENGYLEIKDRIKDLIYIETDYGWENISTIEIEKVICQHQDIHDAAVIGFSKNNKEQIFPTILAFVEIKNTREATEEDLLNFCNTVLAPHKRPQRICFVELPRTATGKVRKDLLAKNLANQYCL